MKNFEALSPSKHRDVRIMVDYIDQPDAQTNSVPILVSELLLCGANYPLFLIKNSETGEFMCCALLGFAENENLFLHDGQWSATHIPLTFSRKPFHMTQESNLVYIDIDNPWVNRDRGERLFLDNGEFAPYMTEVIRKLERIAIGMDETQAFIRVLAKHDLIEPVKLDVTFDNDLSEKLNGLYTIKKQGISDLSNTELQQLHQTGALEGAYIMLHSLENVKALAKLKNKRLRLAF